MSDQASIIKTYESMQPKIDEAAKKLEAYHEEFNQLAKDADKLFALSKKVYADERFKPFRYSGADVQRALEALGYPQVGVVPPLSFADIAELCTNYLTEPDKRYDLARHLLIALPDYVQKGQYLEGQLLLNTAYRMVESPTKINLFLFEMFRFGWDEWEAEIEARRKAFLKELGTDVTKLGDLSLEEAEALAVKLVSDPEKKARLMAFYAANPTLRQHDAAEVLQLEQSAVLLLVRDEANPLHLPEHIVKPWLTEELVNKLRPLSAKAREAFEAGKDEEFSALQEKISDIMIETSMDMAAKIFTPEMRMNLVNELKAYRHTLLQNDKLDEFKYAQGALLALSREDLPSNNPLLVTICFESLRRCYANQF